MSTEVLVDKRLVSEIKAAVPCEWGSMAFQVDTDLGPERGCDEAASWIVNWRTHCGHGHPLHPPHTILLCDKHKQILVMLFRRPDLFCMACHCPLDAMSHLINDIRKI